MHDVAIQLEPEEALLFEAGLFACGARALGDVRLPTELADEDFRRRLFERAQAERVTGMVAYLFERLGSDSPLPADWARRYRRLSSMIETCNERRMALTRETVGALRDAGIPVLALKGWDLMLTCYPAGLQRWSDDVDLLVPRAQVFEARDLLLARGMAFGCLSQRTGGIRPPLEEELNRTLDSHQEMPPFVVRLELPELAEHAERVPDLQRGGFHQITVADGGVVIGFVVDLHYALVHDYPQAEPFEKVVEFRHRGFPWTFLSREQMFGYLAAKFYHEIMRGHGRLRHFFDLLALVQQQGASIDWDEALEIIERHVYQPSVFYMAHHVNRLLGPVVPAALIERCDPGQPRLKGQDKLCRYHHWGDFMPKLLRHGVVVPVAL